MSIAVGPGTLVVYSDIGCPWAHATVHRLHERRAALGLDDAVRLDHRAFPLELVNSRPTPRRSLDAEIPVAGGLAPDAGWSIWRRDPSAYPVTTLPALEAVQAAKEQGLRASEALDRALRRAFFADSRCIALRHEILSVAEDCAEVDADTVAKALDDGRARHLVMAQWHAAAGVVQGSPHVLAPDGSGAHHPGVTMHWHGQPPAGFPVVDSDDPLAVDPLLRAAADSRV